jgi:hypothetical protein
MADNPRIILHHYPTSPFAEKIRLIMGSKAMVVSSCTSRGLGSSFAAHSVAPIARQRYSAPMNLATLGL